MKNNLEQAFKSPRSSNLELLRIISMLLVMVAHYIPVRKFLETEMDLGIAHSIVTLELNSLSIVCVNCFILISGYFGIRWKLKSFLSLLFQLLFWSVLGVFISELLAFLNLINHESITTTMKNLVDWYQGRWFVSAYIFLYILAPLVNSFIEKTTVKELGRYILIFYFFSTIYGYICHSKEFATGLSAISLVGMYLVGAYLKRTDLPIFKCKKGYDIAVYLGLGLLMVLLTVVLWNIGVQSSMYGYLNPIVIIMSISLFQFFRKLDIGQNTVINWVAAGAFAAFLLHCHPSMAFIYDDVLKNIGREFDFAAIYSFLFIVLVFACAVIFDKLRLAIFKMIYGLFNKAHL